MSFFRIQFRPDRAKKKPDTVCTVLQRTTKRKVHILLFVFLDIQTHELYICEPDSPTCPSLFGQVCCRMAAKPYCCEEEVLSGEIGLQKHGGGGKIHKMWSRLMDWKLSLWNDVSHKEAARRPAIDIPVNRDTCILEKGIRDRP